MLLNEKELEKKIAVHREKASTAYMNYNETGSRRYEKTMRDNEDIADTLQAYLESANKIRASRSLISGAGSLVSDAEEYRAAENAAAKEKIVESMLYTIDEFKSMLRFL